MADDGSERQVYDVHTKEIDLVNRDPKHLNDHVVKVRGGLAPKGMMPGRQLSLAAACAFSSKVTGSARTPCSGLGVPSPMLLCSAGGI